MAPPDEAVYQVQDADGFLFGRASPKGHATFRLLTYCLVIGISG